MARRATRQIFAQRVTGRPGLVEKMLDLVGDIPAPREKQHAEPDAQARRIARSAALKAASAAGALALPPGPLGWLTIAPELYAVWKIQAQMVADIAGAHGKRQLLTREQMLYCLFGHTAAGAFRDLVIRVGERYVIRRAPLSALYAIGNKVAIRIAQRSAGRVVTRWVPALGALGVAGYVYYDTGKVAEASMELFAADVRIEGELEVEGVDAVARADASAGRRATGTASPGKPFASKSTAKPATAKPPAAKPTKARKPPSAKPTKAGQPAAKPPAARKSGTGRVAAPRGRAGKPG